MEKPPWHSGRVGGAVSGLLLWFVHILLFFGGGFAAGAAVLAIFFPETFKQIFGNR